MEAASADAASAPSLRDFLFVPPQWKQTRSLTTPWYDGPLWRWLTSLAVVVAVFRLLRPAPAAAGPAALRAWQARKPVGWAVAANARATCVAVFQAGHGYGDPDRVCVHAEAREDFAAKAVLELPGRVALEEPRSVRLAVDTDGTHVAVACGDRVYVLRLQHTGALSLAASYHGLGAPSAAVAAVALHGAAPAPLRLLVLLFSGRLLCVRVARELSHGQFHRPTAREVDVGLHMDSPCCMALAGRVLLVGGQKQQRSCVSLWSLRFDDDEGDDSKSPFAVHQWTDTDGVAGDAVAQVALCGDGGAWGLATLAGGGALLVRCSEAKPQATPLALNCTQLEWVTGCSEVVAADWARGTVQLLALDPPLARVTPVLSKAFACPQVTGGSGGRFFLLSTSSARRAVAAAITPAKLREWQRTAQEERTPWGAARATLASYAWYFSLPRLELGPRVWEEQQLSSLVQFESLTPAQMVQRKLAAEAYDEALAVAAHFALDRDPVLQQRWRAHVAAGAVVSAADAAAHLQPMADTGWVLRQCAGWVARSAVEAHALLSFALSYAHGLHSPTGDAYALLFRDRLARLATYEAACTFDSDDFANFCRQHLAVAALVHAQHGRAAVAQLLLERHAAAVLPFRFHVLSCLPETTPLAALAPLLPRVVDGAEALWAGDSRGDVLEDSGLSVEALRALRAALRDGAGPVARALGDEWAPLVRALVFPAESVRVLDANYEADEALQRPAAMVARWWLQRVEAIDTQSGQLDLALAFAEEGLRRGVPQLEEAAQRLRELCDLVYTLGAASAPSLATYCAASEYQRCFAFLALLAVDGSNADPLLAAARRHFGAAPLEAHLRRFGVHCAQTAQGAPVAALLVRRSVPAVPEALRPFAAASTALECALEFAYCCPDPALHPTWEAMLRALPSRVTHTGNAQLCALHDRLDTLEAHLEAAAALQRLGLPTTLGALAAVAGAADAEGLLGRVVASCARRAANMDTAQWNGVLRDLLLLRRAALEALPVERVYCAFVRLAVAARQLDVARKVLPECGSAGEEAVVAAATELFDASSALDHPDVALAAAALALLPPQPAACEQRVRLRGLCDAAAALHALGVQLVPLQMKPWGQQTAADAFVRVEQALGRRQPGPAELPAALAERVAVWLGCPGEGMRLRVALAESALRHGDFQHAVDAALALGSPALALRCFEYARSAKGVTGFVLLRDVHQLGGILLLLGDASPHHVALVRQAERTLLVREARAPPADPEPQAEALRPRAACLGALYGGAARGDSPAWLPLRLEGVSGSLPLSDAALLTAAAHAPRETALRLCDACSSVKVPAMWLSSRQRHHTLAAFVARHPEARLEPLVPAGLGPDPDATVEQPSGGADAPLVRQTAPTPSNDVAEDEEDIAKIARSVWNKLW